MKIENVFLGFLTCAFFYAVGFANSSFYYENNPRIVHDIVTETPSQCTDPDVNDALSKVIILRHPELTDGQRILDMALKSKSRVGLVVDHVVKDEIIKDMCSMNVPFISKRVTFAHNKTEDGFVQISHYYEWTDDGR